MGYRLEVRIDDVPALPRVLDHAHWRVVAQHRTKWRMLVKYAVGGKGPEVPLERARVSIVIHNKRAPDPDNLVASIKPILDGLQPGGRYVGADVIANDTAESFVGGAALVSFVKLAKGERKHMVIMVEEA